MFARKRVLVVVSVVTLCGAVSLSSALTSSADGGGADRVEAVAGSVSSNAKGALATARLPLARTAARDFVASGPGVTVSVPGQSHGKVSIAQLANGTRSTLRMALPSRVEIAGRTSRDGTVVYDDVSPETSLAVQATRDGVRIHSVLGSRDAATEFAYPVDLPKGARMKALDGGGVLILGSGGALLGGFAPPWSKDSLQQAVPTHFEIRGATLVQVVEHRSGRFSYPVVADPYLGFDLISSARWAIHPQGRTFEVTPTGWSRTLAGNYLAGVLGWDELYARYRFGGLNTNLDGMRDQYICHQQFVAIVAPLKGTWNLDEWRPNVSFPQTVRANCNP